MSEANCNILIVDDFKTNILYMQNILENEKFKICPCTDTDEAINIIGEQSFDLILLDIVMPKTDGYGMCQIVRKSEHNKHTPIIFITSQKEERNIIKAFELGGQDYVTRPFQEKELIARVRTHVELKKRREQLEFMNNNLNNLVDIQTQELNTMLEKLRESYEELKYAKKELESLEKIKENFLNIISHEIRTPLNGIMGFSSLLKDELTEFKYVNYLNMMDESVKRLEKFSLEALLITELKTGKYVINYEPIDLRFQIKELEEKHCKLIESKGLKIRCDLEIMNIYGDTFLIYQVLSNIFENAVICSPENGMIKITGIVSEDYYCLSIMDEGKGFPEFVFHNLEKSFINENFIDNNPGLGLYTAYTIMKFLNGDIKLSNNYYGGANVVIKTKLEEEKHRLLST